MTKKKKPAPAPAPLATAAASASAAPALPTAPTALFSLRDAARALGLIAFAAALGLALNTQKARPLPILSAGPGALPDKAPRIAAQELQGMSRSYAVLLDIREPDVTAQGSPKGALRAPMSRFIEELNAQDLPTKLAAAEIVVLVCENADCPLADRAYKLLEPLKLKNLRVLQGGWESYVQQNLPTEKPFTSVGDTP